MTPILKLSMLTYIVTLPRERHYEPESMKAKFKELADFKQFDAYSVVDCPKDKPLLTTQWVLTEKEMEGPDCKETYRVRKARLCARGDLEPEKGLFPTESPTTSKTSVRILLLNAASNPSWKVQASDVTRAFLQSSQIQREVYIILKLSVRKLGLILLSDLYNTIIFGVIFLLLRAGVYRGELTFKCIPEML